MKEKCLEFKLLATVKNEEQNLEVFRRQRKMEHMEENLMISFI